MKPEEFQLRTYGDPVLRQRAREIQEFGSLLKRQAEKMFEIMYEHGGVGLAANQVGWLERLIVLDVALDDDDDGNRAVLALVNPEIRERSGSETCDEGCLSVPELRADVTRATHLKVEALNLKGAPVAFEAEGMLARAIQHEIDHLDGVLFVDRLSPVRRKLVEGRLKQMAREQAAG
jgi:peptide deformylase